MDQEQLFASTWLLDSQADNYPLFDTQELLTSFTQGTEREYIDTHRNDEFGNNCETIKKLSLNSIVETITDSQMAEMYDALPQRVNLNPNNSQVMNSQDFSTFLNENPNVMIAMNDTQSQNFELDLEFTVPPSIPKRKREKEKRVSKIEILREKVEQEINTILNTSVLPKHLKHVQPFTTIKQFYIALVQNNRSGNIEQSEILNFTKQIEEKHSQDNPKITQILMKHKKFTLVQKTLLGTVVDFEKIENTKKLEKIKFNLIRKEVTKETYNLTEWWEPTKTVLENVESVVYGSLPPELFGKSWIPKVCISILFLLSDHVETLGFPDWIKNTYTSQRNVKKPEITNIYLLLNRIISLISLKNNFLMTQTDIHDISSGVFKLMQNNAKERADRLQKFLCIHFKKDKTQQKLSKFFKVPESPKKKVKK